MTPTELEQAINEIEKDVDRLHALYNQYFMGIEKLEPSVPRKNLDRKIYILRREQIQNTALRFRLQMQIQKYNTQSTYWNRVCRQIENGTYTRQVMLAQKRVSERHKYSEIPPARSSTPPAPPTSYEDLDNAFHIDLDDFGSELTDPLSAAGFSAEKAAIAQQEDPFADLLTNNTDNDQFRNQQKGPDVSPPQKTAPQSHISPPPKSASAGSPRRPNIAAGPVTPQRPVSSHVATSTDPEKLKTIYRRYLAARKKCNEPVGNITYNMVANSLKERIAKSQGKVDFKVVVRGGKAIIKTIKTDD